MRPEKNAPLIAETTESLKIGDSQTDLEHEILLRILQRLSERADSFVGNTDFLDELSQLGSRLFQHFSQEENFMRSIGVPQEMLADHIRAHTDILAQYTELNIELMNGQRYDKATILKLVKEWILAHNSKYDMAIKGYIRNPS